MKPSPTESLATRRSVMFSPIVAMSSCRRSFTVVFAPGKCAASSASMVPSPMSAIFAASRAKAWNWSLRATKSVSELTSRTVAVRPEDSTAIRPSAATRPAFFAALARPFLRSQSTAPSTSPAVSLSAALQSIMPAPVLSRSSFTIAAVTFAMAVPSDLMGRPALGRAPGRRWFSPARRPGTAPDPTQAASIERAGLGDPAVTVDAAVQLQLRVELRRVLGLHRRKLPVVEDAGIVELARELRADAVELGQVVRRAARRGEELELLDLFRRHVRVRRDVLDDRRLGGADVEPELAMAARDAVDGGAGDEVAIERDGAPGVVVRRHREGDAIRVRVRVDDRRDRDAEALGLLDRELLLVGVDHEQEVGGAAHVLDAAERLVELLLLAGEHQALLLGEAAARARRPAGTERLVELAQPRDRGRDRLPVGQHAAEPARVDVVLRRALGRIGDRVGSLAFRADEQHPSALGDRVAHRLEGAVEHRHRLGEVDDVDVVAGAEDVLRHLRIPAVGLVTKVSASLKQLAHRKIGQRHRSLRLSRRGAVDRV